jgi:hypothetical protein
MVVRGGANEGDAVVMAPTRRIQEAKALAS